MKSLQGLKVVVALGLVFILALAGCRELAEPAPTGPYGELRMAVGTFGNEKLDPTIAMSETAISLLSPIYDFIVRADGPRQVPGIAERWEMAPDGLSWTFYIREGIKFHNGEDLTADDVKFSLDRYLSDVVVYGHLRGSVERVEVVDNYTIRVYTKGLQILIPDQCGGEPNALEGLVVPKDYTEEYGWEYLNLHPVGSGPFKFVRHVPGDLVEYEAVEEHWRQTPAFKKLTTTLVPEETTRVLMLKTGEIDVIDIGLESAMELRQAGFRTFALSDLSTVVRVLGPYDPRAVDMPVADIRVRQALSLAINRDEIINVFFSGLAGPPLPPHLTVSKREIDADYWLDYATKLYRYDPEEARQLLREAGYPDGFNWKFYTFDIGGAPYAFDLAEVLQGYWQEIGVNTELVPMDLGAFKQLRGVGSGPDRAPAPEAIGAGCIIAHGERPYLYGDLNNHFHSGTTWSAVGTALPELDRVLDAYVEAVDASERERLIAEAIKIMTDTFVSITICTVPEVGALGPRVDITFPKMASGFPFYADVVKHRTG